MHMSHTHTHTHIVAHEPRLARGAAATRCGAPAAKMSAKTSPLLLSLYFGSITAL
jgi:hypothetical protein